MPKHRMFVDLDRRFIPCEPDRYGLDPASLFRMGVWTEAASWAQLLEHKRVVVLGEAGTGKTSEFRRQSELLTRAGATAFFLRLEDLTKRNHGLVAADRRRLDAWAAGEAIGWLFVDAVDETRLRGGTLQASLSELRTLLEEADALAQARILLSCRVTDWLPVRDLDTLEAIFPLDEPPPEGIPSPPARTGEEGDAASQPTVRIYQLAPLDHRRVATLAEAAGVAHGATFVREITNLGALDLAGRPLDVLSMADLYSRGALGRSLLQLIEHDIDTKLTEWDPDRKEHRELSREKCRRGAERLALAVTLCQQAPIKATDDELVTVGDAIAPEVVLSDWRPGEIRALLARPIFDEATFGCVRFHHRSAQELLAARALHRLLDGGRSGVERRLFVRPYPGAPLVVPVPLRPVVAWLATFDERVRLSIRRNTPEHLLSWGDPGAPSVSERLGILEAVMANAGSWARALRNATWSDLAHFGSPEMADRLVELIRTTNHPDAREFLFKLSAAGRIDVSEAAFSALHEPSEHWAVKCMAARSVVTCGASDKLLALGRSLTDEVLAAAVDSLSAVGADDTLMVQACAAAPPGRRHSDLQYSVRLAISARIHTDDQLELIAKLSRLVVTDHDRYSWLVRPICQCLANALGKSAPQYSQVRATLQMLASRNWRPSPELHLVTRALEEHVEIRQEVFWDRVAMLRAKGQWPIEQLREFWDHDAVVAFSGARDFDWMFQAAQTRKEESERALLLRFLLPMGGTPDRRAQIEGTFCNGPDQEQVRQYLQNADASRRREQSHAAETESRQEEQARLEETDRERNREQLIAILPSIRDGSNLQALRHLHVLMVNRAGNTNRWGEHRWQELEGVYGAEVARAARDGWVSGWRSVSPELHADSTPWSVVFALDGLAIEFAEGSAPSSLSANDAKLATRLALREMNAYPCWLASLIETFPTEVHEVLALALDEECRGRTRDLPALERLLGHEASRALMVDWVAARTSSQKTTTARALKLTLGALRQHHGGNQLAQLESLARRRCRKCAADGRVQAFSEWWRFLLCANPRWATDEILNAAHRHPDLGDDLVSAACATLRWESVAATADVLRDLSELFYRHIRREEDAPPGRTDRFSPVMPREDAERARNAVLHQLAQTPGREAWVAIQDLASAEVFATNRHWLQRAARDRLEEDAPFRPIAQRDVAAFVRELEEPPRDASALFRLTRRRLEEITEQVELGDFSTRGLFTRKTKELEVQRWLASYLRVMSRGRYQVTREPEVDRQKRPDIRVSASFRGVVSLELKCAQRWSCADLEKALTDQLIGRYLQDSEARHGLLVLTNHTQRYWIGPGSHGRLYFHDLVEHLQNLADGHVADMPHIDDIAVVGIQLDGR